MNQVAISLFATAILNKLASIIHKEIKLFRGHGVGEKSQRLLHEVIEIQSCLRDVDSKHKGDPMVQNWLSELCDVMYHIEDSTDMFSLKVENNQHKKLLQKILKQREINRKFGIEFKSIKHELKEVYQIRDDYGIELQSLSYKGEAVIMPHYRRDACQEVDETEVVGRLVDKNYILKLLCPEETPRLSVITIVGMGGLGKTTLARMIYQSARADFQYHIMLSISQQFTLSEVLRKMIRQYKDSVPENQEEGDLTNDLKTFLSSSRYLIILDDVWEVDLWNKLRDVLPDVNNGSRILITSRSMVVDQSTDSKITPYVLRFLDDRESLDLLLKKALSNQDKECPSHLLEHANKLSKKCLGLPLFLAVLADILATKEQNYHEWERVLQTRNWQSDGKCCMDVLAMSYEDMPYDLKACFLYIASFPEHYEISAKRLTKMWIAEGLISCDETTTMEKRAELFIEELFARSMIQVLCRSMNGSIKRIEVHGHLRELAMQEAEKGIFHMVFSKKLDVKKPNKRIRRATLQAQEWNPQLEKDIGANIRSLLLFGCEWFGQILECSNFRLLKVLELVGNNDNLRLVTSAGLKSLDGLIYLKYMGIRNCSIDIIPCSFNRMKSLETLDVRGTGAEVSNDIWTISTLRHVLCDHVNARVALDGPTSTSDITNLQTMQWIQPPKTWEMELPLLDNLRKLGVCEVDDWVTLTNLLKTLPLLISLGIKARWYESLPMEIFYQETHPNYHNLQSLYLKGKWTKTVTLEASLFPPHLIKLTLFDSELEKNPMPELGKLERLKKLRIGEFVLNDSGPTICPDGFPVLQHLEVTDFNMKGLTVTPGVMSKLAYLHVHPNMELDLPPDLQHVTIDRL